MMTELLVFIIIVCLSTFCTCLAQYNIVCGGSGDDLKLVPSADGVLGRYTLEYCLQTKSDIIAWQSILTVDQRPPNKCIEYVSQLDRAQKHSILNYGIEKHLNCSNVCLSSAVDLIYGGCYTMRMQVKLASGRADHKYVLQHVANGLSVTNFTQTQVLTHAQNEANGVLIKFYFKNIPLTDYNIELCNNKSTQQCSQIENVCEHSTYMISCLVGNITNGTYTAYLTLEAPWTHGDVIPANKHTTRVTFDYADASLVPVLEDSLRPLWVGVLCVCALGVVALVCACACMRHRGTRTFKGLVAQQWRQRYAEISKRVESVSLSPDSNGLVVLYARDCAPFMKAIEALKEVLREQLDCKVYDLFEPSTVCELSPSPTQWLHQCIHTCHVLLIETYAAQHLYNANVQGGLTLSSPLLGSVALYKNAQPGDSYLQYCLALIRDNAHRTNAYNKFYIARIDTMPYEVLPAVVPHTRYTLPQHTHTLLAQLHRHTSHTPPRAHTQTHTLHTHIQEYIQYVNDNPNYLKDELMFL